MTGFRMKRINKELQREISMLLELRVKEESVKNAVITDVDCSKDLSIAKVYFTTIKPEDRQDVSNGLKKVSSFLRSALGRVLHIRKVPKLIFIYDRSEDYGRSIDSILDRLTVERKNHHNDGSQE